MTGSDERRAASARLAAGTTLHRAAGLNIRFDDGGDPVVERPEQPGLSAGPLGLIVLDVFSRPMTLAEATEALRGRVTGSQAFMRALDTVYACVEAGVLQSDAGEVSTPDMPESGYARPDVHRVMLDDRIRTEAFLRAIRQVVREGDVVVDIGTGSGVLATAAALAGASRVYAIEASGIADVARQVFDANEVGDRVSVVRGWSTAAEIPEPADVLVSEMLGNDPLDERLLEITIDARTRLLKPGARLVPSSVRIVGRAVWLPEDDSARMRLGAATIDEWRAAFGIDLSPVMHSARASTHSAMPRSERLATWQPRGEVVVLADIDLATVQGAQVDARAPLVFDEDTEIDGAVLWFDAPLGGDVSITTDPFDPGRASHWRNQVVVLGERTVVRAGEPAHLTYRYRVPGHRDGLDLVVGDSDAPVS
jgi:hypothetical protein